MSDVRSRQFTGVLTEAEEGEAIVLEESPSGGLLLTRGKNKIALWPDQLQVILKVFKDWQDGQ